MLDQLPGRHHQLSLRVNALSPSPTHVHGVWRAGCCWPRVERAGSTHQPLSPAQADRNGHSRPSPSQSRGTRHTPIAARSWTPVGTDIAIRYDRMPTVAPSPKRAGSLTGDELGTLVWPHYIISRSPDDQQRLVASPCGFSRASFEALARAREPVTARSLTGFKGGGGGGPRRGRWLLSAMRKRSGYGSRDCVLRDKDGSALRCGSRGDGAALKATGAHPERAPDSGSSNSALRDYAWSCVLEDTERRERRRRAP